MKIASKALRNWSELITQNQTCESSLCNLQERTKYRRIYLYEYSLNEELCSCILSKWIISLRLEWMPLQSCLVYGNYINQWIVLQVVGTFYSYNAILNPCTTKLPQCILPNKYLHHNYSYRELLCIPMKIVTINNYLLKVSTLVLSIWQCSIEEVEADFKFCKVGHEPPKVFMNDPWHSIIENSKFFQLDQFEHLGRDWSNDVIIFQVR